MSSKPILLWPKPASEIEGRLGRPADDFVIVDTNCLYDLQKLYKLSRETPVFDPFPRAGAHYRAFRDHVVASHGSLHIVGLPTCRNVLRALQDPSLARAPIEELLAVIAPARGEATNWQAKISVDWSRLTWTNTMLVAGLVFVASVAGNAMLFGDALMTAAATTLVFAVLYVVLRLDLRGLRSGKVWRPHRADT